MKRNTVRAENTIDFAVAPPRREINTTEQNCRTEDPIQNEIDAFNQNNNGKVHQG